MDKYTLIDQAICRLSDLADARGVEKCVMIVETVKTLSKVKEILHVEDAMHAKAAAQAEEERAAQEQEDEADTETVGGKEYKIG